MGPTRRAIPTGYLVYEIELTGISPLLMSNGEVDRDSDQYIAYENLAAQKRKTREQRAQLRELEWYTRIYFDDDLGPFIPAKNVKELIRSAATKTRDGENVRRGLVIPEYRIPLVYDGPRDAAELWEAGFRYTAMVANAGAGSGRVDRTRPWFPEWSLVFEVAFDAEELDQRRFEDVVARTEKYGLGDYRPEFGSFAAAATFVRMEDAALRVNGHKDINDAEKKAHVARADKVMTVA